MADEKIRLVLNVTGVQDVKQLQQEMQDLAMALGAADSKFEKVSVSSKAASNGLQQAEGAVGKKGGVGAAGNLLTLSYILDDVQYGFRGIVNNIPQLVQGMGLGAGVAGVAGIAAVAINQLIQTFPELTGGMNKAKPKMEELTSSVGKQTAEVEKLKKEYEKLKDVDKDTFANRAKLITVTEDLKDAEERLRKEKEAMRAFEDAEKSVGDGETDKVKRQQQSFKELIVETGRLKALRDQMMSDVSRREDTPISDDEAAIAGAKAGDSFQNVKGGYKPEDHNDLAASIYNRATDKKKLEMRQRGVAAIQQQRIQDQKERVGSILGRMQNAKTEEDLNKAYEEMAQISPAAANELRIYHQTRLESEELDKQVEGSIAGMQAARAAREKKLAEGAKQINNMKKFFGATEQAGKKEDAKAKAKTQEADKAEKAEVQRQQNRDRTLAQNGLTPEGLAAQRQNSGVGATAAANRNRAAAGNNQEKQLQDLFSRQGMSEKEAKKTTQEVMQAGDKIVRTMVQNGQLTLNRFKQIEMTQNEINRQMAQQAAGQVGMPGRQFNAGRR